MNPCSFVGANSVLDTPAGVDPDAVEPLVVYRDGHHVLSCWKVTAAELAEIQKTGRIWLWAQGTTQPPVAITGHDPFSQPEGQG